MSQLPATDRQNVSVYLCGPDGMMAEARSALSMVGVPAEQVHKESFVTAPVAAGDVVEEPLTAAESGSPDVTILYEGSDTSLRWLHTKPFWKPRWTGY